MDRDKIDEKKVVDYATTMELAKRCIGERHFDAPSNHVRESHFLDPSRPEAFNLMGASHGNSARFRRSAQALPGATSLDPTYEPARKNLERITSYHREGSIILGKSGRIQKTARKMQPL